MRPSNLTKKEHDILSATLMSEIMEISLAESNLVGLFAKANSNGMILSNLASEEEVRAMKAEAGRAERRDPAEQHKRDRVATSWPTTR